MASAIVMADVKAYLAAGWSRVPVEHPNETSVAPADGSAFLAVQYPIAGEEQMSIGAPGANVFREEGVIRLVMMIPRGAGVEPWNTWLDEARTLFRAKQFGVVRTYEASPAVLDDRNDDGKYWALSSAITYDADFLG